MKEANVDGRSDEDLVELLFRQTSNLIFVKDTDHRIERANERYAAAFGSSPEALVGRSTRSLWPDDVVDSVLEDERRVLGGQEVRDRERRFSRPDSSACWYSINYVPRYDDSGAVQGFLAIGREIAERKRIERELDLFKNAVEATGHAVYITDADGTIEYANPAFESVTGYAREEAVGRTPLLLRSDEMPDGYYDELWATVLDGDVWDEEIINRRDNGELYQAHQTIAPITDSAGELFAFVAIQTDITEWKAKETSLRRYRQTIENSTNLLAAVDRRGTFLFANERFRHFHGLGDADLSDETFGETIGLQRFSSVEPYLERVLEGESVEFEVTRQDAAGNARRLAINGYPLRDDDGTVVAAAVSMQDIPDEYEQSQRIELLAEYRRVMSRVNRTLVRTVDVEAMLEKVTDIIASSELFGCTFAALVEGTSPTFVCDSGSDLDGESVAAFHTEEYLERVLDEEFYWMDDVTVPPFAQHENDVHSHPGVGIALRYEDEPYGVLTVHFRRGLEPDAESRELLSEVADDIGFFLHGREMERERVRKERQLREEKQRYESLFDSIRDAILVTDSDRRIVNCNSAFEDLFGYDCEEISGKQTRFVYENEAEYLAMGDALEGNIGDPQFNYTATYEKRSGRTFPGETNVFYLRGYDDEVRGFIGLIRDVSDREDRLKQLQVIDRVLRHNVNNDMNVIKGYAQMIQESTDSESVMHAERIVQTSEKLLETTAKERQITRLLSKQGSARQYEVEAFISDVVSTMRDRYPAAEIQTALPTDPSVGVPGGIPRAIEELLENAITHSDREQPEIELTISVSAGVLRIRVADDGPGIPAMEREVLSGRTEIGPLYHGSGLGLWFVNLAVRQADGVLEFEGNEPRGSIVSIRLPT